MQPDQVEEATRRFAYRAGWTRVALALAAMFLLPVDLGLRWVFGVYILIAFGIQLLIFRDVGGEHRAIAGGACDVAIISFVVQRAGSASTVLVALYIYLAVVMALIHTRRVSRALSVMVIVTYLGISLAEQAHLLPYAPDSVTWGPHVAPTLGGAALSVVLVGLLVGVTTEVIGKQAEAIRARERELIAANRGLEELTLRDPLTRLFNRRHVLQRIDLELARVRRGARAAVLMADLDHFKRVNDELGHLAGDDLLQKVAAAIAATVRDTDVAARYGGDEFVIVLADADESQAAAAAERLVTAVRAVGRAFDAERAVTVSIGAAYARPDDSARTAVMRADDNVYRAKERGGNCAVGDDGVERSEPRRRASVPPC